MQPVAVVEHRDVGDDVGARLLTGLVAAPLDPFGFQGAKEALHVTDCWSGPIASWMPRPWTMFCTEDPSSKLLSRHSGYAVSFARSVRIDPTPHARQFESCSRATIPAGSKGVSESGSCTRPRWTAHAGSRAQPASRWMQNLSPVARNRRTCRSPLAGDAGTAGRLDGGASCKEVYWSKVAKLVGKT
jgi:hypothetical protein